MWRTPCLAELHHKELSITEFKNKEDNTFPSLKYPLKCSLTRPVNLRQQEAICLYIQSDTRTKQYTEGIVSHLSPMHSWLANEINVIKWVAFMSSENKNAPIFLKQKMHVAQAVKKSPLQKCWFFYSS